MNDLLHNEIMRAIGTIEGKMDGVANDIREVKNQARLTNGRITILERWKEQVKGGTKVVNLLWGTLIGLGLLIIQNYFLNELTGHFLVAENLKRFQKSETYSIRSINFLNIIHGSFFLFK